MIDVPKELMSQFDSVLHKKPFHIRTFIFIKSGSSTIWISVMNIVTLTLNDKASHIF